MSADVAAGRHVASVPRLITIAALVVVAAACWWLFARSAAVMSSMEGDSVMLAMANAMMTPTATLPYLAASALMWLVMMGAMMAPAALPITLVFVRLDRERDARSLPVDGLSFATGYFSAWSLFAVAATTLQWALHRSALL